MAKYEPKPCKGHPGWYEIPGFSKYAANRKGFILNKRLENSTQGGVSGRYRKVSVYADGEKEPKLRYTHDLICRAFHGKSKKGQVVIHKDNDRLNIKPGNLKWGTQSENIQDMWDDGLREGNESFSKLTHRTLYHGSDKKFDTIEPRGVNMGPRGSKPKVSSFFWATKEEALGWMVYQVLRRQGGIKCYYHIPSGGFLVTPDNAKAAKRFLRKAKGYLYTANLRLDKVGVGSSPDIREYTVDEPVVPDDVSEVSIDQALLDKYMLVDEKDNIKAYMRDIKYGKYSNRRGLVLSLLLDRERDFQRHDPKIREELGLENLPTSANW